MEEERIGYQGRCRYSIFKRPPPAMHQSLCHSCYLFESIPTTYALVSYSYFLQVTVTLIN
jgi:hypothetical protein